MARTKQEVRDFLNSQVGRVPQHPAPYQDLSGQCVTLIKVLMDFLGVPNPYAARGNAISVNDTLLRQGIANNGKGWLTIVVNRDMGYIGGVHYGHIWIDLAGESNFESNGARALYTTKNTRPIQQGQQFVNLDKYIIGDEMPIPDADNYYWRYGQKLATFVRGRQLSRDEFRRALVGKSDLTAVEILSDDVEADRTQQAQEVGQLAIRDNWQQQIYNLQDALKGRPTPEQLAAVNANLAEMSKKLNEANEVAGVKIEENKKLSEKIAEYEKKESDDKQVADTWLRRLGQFLEKYWVAK